MEVKIWVGMNENATAYSNWTVQKNRQEVGTVYDIVYPKIIILTIPDDDDPELPPELEEPDRSVSSDQLINDEPAHIPGDDGGG